MKFAKSLLAQSSAFGSLHVIAFKRLKKLIKRLQSSYDLSDLPQCFSLHVEFASIFDAELLLVGESFKCELDRISRKNDSLCEDIHHLFATAPDSLYGLHSYLGDAPVAADLEETIRRAILSSHIDVNNPADSRYPLLCILDRLMTNLLSCRRLRLFVLWNSVAVVKILKKRQRHLGAFWSSWDQKSLHVERKVWCESESISILFRSLDCAAVLLASQPWYSSSTLAPLTSSVEALIHSVFRSMGVNTTPRESFECPVCLDLIKDPVALRSCGHRFCWSCLKRTYYSERQGAILERCPICRVPFAFDIQTFEVDTTFSRFLKDTFPEDFEVVIVPEDLKEDNATDEALEKTRHEEPDFAVVMSVVKSILPPSPAISAKPSYCTEPVIPEESVEKLITSRNTQTKNASMSASLVTALEMSSTVSSDEEDPLSETLLNLTRSLRGDDICCLKSIATESGGAGLEHSTSFFDTVLVHSTRRGDSLVQLQQSHSASSRYYSFIGRNDPSPLLLPKSIVTKNSDDLDEGDEGDPFLDPDILGGVTSSAPLSEASRQMCPILWEFEVSQVFQKPEQSFAAILGQLNGDDGKNSTCEYATPSPTPRRVLSKVQQDCSIGRLSGARGGLKESLMNEFTQQNRQLTNPRPEFPIFSEQPDGSLHVDVSTLPQRQKRGLRPKPQLST